MPLFVACVGTTPRDPRNVSLGDRGCPAKTIGIALAILLVGRGTQPGGWVVVLNATWDYSLSGWIAKAGVDIFDIFFLRFLPRFAFFFFLFNSVIFVFDGMTDSSLSDR